MIYFLYIKGRPIPTKHLFYMVTKNLKQKIGVALGAGSALALSVATAFGQTFSAASTTALVQTAITDWGAVAIVVLGSVLGVFALLLAAGFGISRLRRYIHGKKV